MIRDSRVTPKPVRTAVHLLLLGALLVAGCGRAASATATAPPPIVESLPAATEELVSAVEAGPAYRDPDLPLPERVQDLLSRMTLAEKVGQMTQVEKNSVKKEDITAHFIGSLLSGGGGYPQPNTPEAWLAMVNEFQEYALATRLGIPLIYGVDAVHGHSNVKGATIFPHNIGLGASRDPELVRRIGRATAEEVAATGVHWSFSPGVMVPQDIRWGRTYEGYSEDTELVSTLAAAYVRGLQGAGPEVDLAHPTTILATPKHYVGDGGTAWGSSTASDYELDQGVTDVDEATLRAVHLPPYKVAIDAGARSIMVSFSSWGGLKMHAQKYLLTDVLKGELGFEGFLISDWQAIDQIPGDYYGDVVTAINAGLDMIMVPYEYERFISTLTKAVENGDVPMERIDDAVCRILTVKFELGLFEHPQADDSMLDSVGSEAHGRLAREAVRKTLVLLKNEGQTLPLARDVPLIFVGGQAADDVGIQCGGWTIEWQGATGRITPGTTILDAVRQAVSAETSVYYDRSGEFEDVADAAENLAVADVGIAVVGERPYAEGIGDKADLGLTWNDIKVIQALRERSRKLVVILISGRPMVITHQLPLADAFVAAWLPGTEGQGVTDVLFGDHSFTGRLAYTWPRAVDQLPFDFSNLPTEGCDAPLFPFGYGLDVESGATAELPECPATGG